MLDLCPRHKTPRTNGRCAECFHATWACLDLNLDQPRYPEPCVVVPLPSRCDCCDGPSSTGDLCLTCSGQSDFFDQPASR